MQFMASDAPVPVAVLGASGYTGGEVVRLLASHPGAEITFLGAKESAGVTLAEAHPHLAALPESSRVLESLDPGSVVAAAQVAFLCLPHGTSSKLAPALLEAGVRVVDLAGDFRLPAYAYPEWYAFEHPSPEWIDKAVYGLPELLAGDIGGAELVANPGCFPTPVILGLAPLLSAGLIEPEPIRVDGKSGLSGAGRASGESGSYAAAQESVRPYRFPKHQHTPEMERGIELSTGVSVSVVFVPHLVPSVRGVLTTSYARLGAAAGTGSLVDCLVEAYATAPFVRVLPPGAMVDTKRLRGSNLVELQAVADPRTGTAIVEGALDNLVKGAAGQAIQNFNLMSGFDQALGLPRAAMYP
jgi:N-acetyl-gamma-glutamyl-phosphate reductase